MDRLKVVFIRGVLAWLPAFVGQLGCAAEQASVAEKTGINAGSGEVAASVEALRRSCRHTPGHPHCRHHECGDGVVEHGEACDDGNLEDGDGCSAQCELDDISATPGDDRAGYVLCRQSNPTFTCGPDQGCCAQPNPTGPACAAEQSECGQNPTFQACDGPEDCADGLRCVGTRFGNICGTSGYYWVCHTDAHCASSSRPICSEVGICRELDVCGDGIVGWGEACDDGNTEGGDGCSASCEKDDITTTPGDDRAGYVACGTLAPDLTCGPNQGCCAQVLDDEGNPGGPGCAADRSDCSVNPSFHACDGPEDCDDGVYCMGTRFGNICGSGYYRACHSDADCESSRPSCGSGGVCGS